MKLTALITLVMLAAVSGCVLDRPAAVPIGQTQTTSGLICPRGQEPSADGETCVKAPPPQYDVP